MAFPFERVSVGYAVEGGARVTWVMSRHFVDPLPHTFQLQVTKTSAPTADDWEDVGEEVENLFYATDGEKRIWGKSLEVHYRVKLTTQRGVFYSEPAAMTTVLTTRDWNEVRELYRQYKKVLSKFKGTQGLLVKRRRYGTPCPVCLDEMTEQGTRDNCETCYGTEISGGYYTPIPNFYVDMSVQQARERVDTNVRGTTKDTNIAGLCAGDILVNSRDLFVETRSDRRWNIETVATKSEHRAFPICLQLELRQLPFSHVAYKIPLE